MIQEASILKKDNELCSAAVAVEIIEPNVKPADRQAFTRDDAPFTLERPVLRFAATAMPEDRWADLAMRVERMKVTGCRCGDCSKPLRMLVCPLASHTCTPAGSAITSALRFDEDGKRSGNERGISGPRDAHA
jgi:hypothetical protein